MGISFVLVSGFDHFYFRKLEITAHCVAAYIKRIVDAGAVMPESSVKPYTLVTFINIFSSTRFISLPDRVSLP